MARSSLFRKLQKIARIAEEADRRGLSSREAVELAAERKLWTPTRRDLLRGGAAAVGVAAIPGRALAAPLKSSPVVGVVGVGLAGLSCMDSLAAKGITATGYEASGRTGGRCFSMGGAFAGPVLFPGQVVERGGELIDTAHGTMRGWAREFGLDLELAEIDGETLFYVDGELYDEADVVDEYRALVDAIRDDLRTIGAPTAEAHTDADAALDVVDLATYLDTRGAGDLIRGILEAAYRGEYGLEIDEQSCLNLLLFMHADRRSKFRPFGVFSDERFHTVGGNQQIAAALTARHEAHVELGHQLVAVAETSTGRIRLTFDTAGGTFETTVDHAVLAIPFSVLRDVDLSGVALPSWKKRAIDELVYGTNSKHMVGFTGRPWRAEDVHCSGAIYASGLDHLSNTWETNPSVGSDTRGVMTNYKGGDGGLTIDPKKTDAETKAFLADLDAVIPGASAYARKDGSRYVAHIENWSKSAWQKGSYTCNHPGYFTTICDLEAKPVGNLRFAGEHTSSFYEWQGFMEGAALSGARAAAEIVAASK